MLTADDVEVTNRIEIVLELTGSLSSREGILQPLPRVSPVRIYFLWMITTKAFDINGPLYSLSKTSHRAGLE